MSGETLRTCLCDHGSIVCGRFGGEHRNLCFQRCGWPERSEHLAGKREPLGGDTCRWEEKPRHCSWGGKEETGPMLGGEGLISQRSGMGVMAKQPETSYCWGPISQGERGRDPMGVPKVAYLTQFAYMVPTCLMAGSCACGYLCGHLGPQVGQGVGGRTSLLCPKGGPKTSPCIAGSWVRAQGPSALLPLLGQCPCQAGRIGP